MASATLEAVDRHAVGGTRSPAPDSPAGLLRLAGLTDLDGVDLNELERRLRHLTTQLQGADALSSTPEQFAAYIRDDFVKWTRIVKDANVKVD